MKHLPKASPFEKRAEFACIQLSKCARPSRIMLPATCACTLTQTASPRPKPIRRAGNHLPARAKRNNQKSEGKHSAVNRNDDVITNALAKLDYCAARRRQCNALSGQSASARNPHAKMYVAGPSWQPCNRADIPPHNSATAIKHSQRARRHLLAPRAVCQHAHSPLAL